MPTKVTTLLPLESDETWAGLATQFSLVWTAWPHGCGQRQDSRMAGWYDGRHYSGGAGGTQQFSRSGSSTGRELSPHLEISITWLLFSNLYVHSSEQVTLPLCSPCVCRRPCVLPSPTAPAFLMAKGALHPTAQRGRKPLTHCPLPSREKFSEP